MIFVNEFYNTWSYLLTWMFVENVVWIYETLDNLKNFFQIIRVDEVL